MNLYKATVDIHLQEKKNILIRKDEVYILVGAIGTNVILSNDTELEDVMIDASVFKVCFKEVL